MELKINDWEIIKGKEHHELESSNAAFQGGYEYFLATIRPAFVNTLFPVTRPHHIYSTALVIIILIDNLKYVIIFVYVWFLPWKIGEVSENASRCPSKQNFR